MNCSTSTITSSSTTDDPTSSSTTDDPTSSSTTDDPTSSSTTDDPPPDPGTVISSVLVIRNNTVFDGPLVLDDADLVVPEHITITIKG